MRSLEEQIAEHVADAGGPNRSYSRKKGCSVTSSSPATPYLLAMTQGTQSPFDDFKSRSCSVPNKISISSTSFSSCQRHVCKCQNKPVQTIWEILKGTWATIHIRQSQPPGPQAFFRIGVQQGLDEGPRVLHVEPRAGLCTPLHTPWRTNTVELKQISDY